MTLQHHAKFENDPMSGLGDTAWDGRKDGRTDIHGSFQDSTSARGTKWNNELMIDLLKRVVQTATIGLLTVDLLKFVVHHVHGANRFDTDICVGVAIGGDFKAFKKSLKGIETIENFPDA